MSSSNCIFCKIVNKSSPADIKFENDEILIFKDIKPAAIHHYLSIPKEHIANVNSLNSPEHKGLLDRLLAEGKKAVEDQGGDVNDLRLGFHLPPFNTVGHLHLHVISPASSMGLMHRIMFKPHTLWFSSVEQIYERLEKIIEINNKL
ncbi:unnamed protein product [Ceutorhynchus assimilis]|uniref:Adenosine 5'-monophosphoramidase HINT3 n=1 Tax=Ceutorhynchus assimilis TaxID=467358 RepID=A0A9N9MH62_9CUCU|nr:unnamed protein product [Ceutorhynchus assimilis]